MPKEMERDSEANGSENLGGESEGGIKEKRQLRMTKQRLSSAKNNPSKRSKMSQKLEKDSENSESGSDEGKNNEKKHKYAKTIRKSVKGNNKKIQKNNEKIDAKLIKCNICEKEFKLYAALVRHQKGHNKFNYRCGLCKDKFELRTSFSAHMTQFHPQVDMFLCEYCEQSFKTQKKMRDHEKSHLKYVCRFCKRGFLRPNIMETHVQEVHY